MTAVGTDLRDPARRVLEGNWTGRFTVPSRTQYPHQWGWDAAYIAVGWAHLDPERARLELESILGAQWPDGRVPHIRFDPAAPPGGYFPGPDFWRAATAAGVPTSGIVQPPLQTPAALAVGGRAFLERVYPALERQLAYLRDRRDVAGDGLVAIVHPWESLDNSPLWDDALAALDISGLPDYRRADLTHVDPAERPTAADYDRYVYLAAWYRDRGYRDDLAGAPFALEDPLFNALVCWGWEALAEIAEAVGADPAPHRRDAARVRGGLLARLWDPDAGCFWARDLRAGLLVRRRTVAALAPLVDPGLPAEVAAALVGTLRSPAFRSPFGVPTYDLTAPDCDPRRYWRGPVWININWLLARGLRAHGYAELAAAVDAGTVALVRGAGFREYFDPRTGEGRGADDFSWTAALLLEAL
jgi:hypothetical protein